MREAEYRARPFVKELRRKMTDAEVVLWSRLQRKQLHGFAFRRQHPIGPFIADFACVSERVVVEVDGGPHFDDDAIEYDRARDRFLREQGWRVVRITNYDVFKHINDVLDHIARMLLPPPPRR